VEVFVKPIEHLAFGGIGSQIANQCSLGRIPAKFFDGSPKIGLSENNPAGEPARPFFGDYTSWGEANRKERKTSLSSLKN
jgi:hypothetical protein